MLIGEVNQKGMFLMNLKETPIPFSDAEKVIPMYSQPFLPVVSDRYLTSVKILLKNGESVILSSAEWIHPEGIAMGKIDISTQNFMVPEIRINKIMLCSKGKSIAGVVIYLTDGGAYILTDGSVQNVNDHMNDDNMACGEEDFIMRCQRARNDNRDVESAVKSVFDIILSSALSKQFYRTLKKNAQRMLGVEEGQFDLSVGQMLADAIKALAYERPEEEWEAETDFHMSIIGNPPMDFEHFFLNVKEKCKKEINAYFFAKSSFDLGSDVEPVMKEVKKMLRKSTRKSSRK